MLIILRLLDPAQINFAVARGNEIGFAALRPSRRIDLIDRQISGYIIRAAIAANRDRQAQAYDYPSSKYHPLS
jgi:hypothetical protein